MTSTAVFAPGILTCSDIAWRDAERQDEFVETLLAHLNMMERLGYSLGWSENLEDAMWTNPHLHPWHADISYRNKLIPVMFRKMRALQQWADIPDNYAPSTLEPDVYTLDWCAHLVLPSLVLLHRLCHNGVAPRIVIAHLGSSPDAVESRCGCSAQANSLSHLTIRSVAAWMFKTDEVAFWPTENSDAAWETFGLGLEVVFQVLYAADPRFLHASRSYHVSAQFKDELLRAAPESRWPLVRALAKRLHLSRLQAERDEGLQNELVKGRKRNDPEWRFRTSGVERIHYQEHDGLMQFVHYYPKGEHDVGLP